MGTDSLTGPFYRRMVYDGDYEYQKGEMADICFSQDGHPCDYMFDDDILWKPLGMPNNYSYAWDFSGTLR